MAEEAALQQPPQDKASGSAGSNAGIKRLAAGSGGTTAARTSIRSSPNNGPLIGRTGRVIGRYWPLLSLVATNVTLARYRPLL
jgi:hypothetical protein